MSSYKGWMEVYVQSDSFPQFIGCYLLLNCLVVEMWYTNKLALVACQFSIHISLVTIVG